SPAATAADPDKSVDDFLQKMCDQGMAIAREKGEGSIDILRTMRQIQRHMKSDPKEKLHVEDGIHLNDTGQLAIAYAILKGLGAPEVVSAATIDAKAASGRGEGCRITNVTASADRVEFDRLDEGLPFNQGLFFNLRYRFVRLPDEMNRYTLTVKNLKPGKYTITAEGRALGSFAADQLEKGINIASATADGWEPGGPWDAQAWSLNFLTDARNE